MERVVLIDQALRSLEEHDSRKAIVFQMRFFGGFSVNEVVESLDISDNTVIRDWSLACAFLRERVAGSPSV